MHTAGVLSWSSVFQAFLAGSCSNGTDPVRGEHLPDFVLGATEQDGAGVAAGGGRAPGWILSQGLPC